MEALTIVSTVTGIAFTIISYFWGKIQGAKQEGVRQGELKVDLLNIKKDLEEIKKDVKIINVGEINTKITQVEKRVKTLEEDYKDLIKNHSA